MNWKDTIKKAPFRVSDEQRTGQKLKLQHRKNLLPKLKPLLEKHVDMPFRRLIRQNPNERAYTVQVPNFFVYVKELMDKGLTNLDIETQLEKEYDVDDVMLDYNAQTITFEM
jgi:hypothetical protein|tara:strand:+ start:41 stop:376 length:336 start_codon:yes stop_codon:yes gene_type:complete